MIEWLPRLDPADIAVVEALISTATATDGIAPVSEQARHALSDRAARSDAGEHAVRRVAGVVVGYANLVPAHDEHPAMAEVVVGPDARGRGIGTELVAAALAHGGRGGRVWAHGDLAPARAVAARLGLRPARELLQLRRSLPRDDTDADALPDLVVPQGVLLRTYAGPADDAELLRVNNAAFDWHPEQGGWTEAEIAARRAEPWFDPLGVFLATDPDGRLLGFHWTKVEAPPLGEVYIVAVDPPAHGRGLGRALTLAGLRHLRARGLDSVLLYTEGDNAAAVRTYGKLGFLRYRTDLAYTL